jgi:predicted RNA binding protein YcfA (HicA-like mRNA interferase family)
MSGLPRISGRECVKALSKIGFYLKRQEGSHMILRRDNPFGQVVVPDFATVHFLRNETLKVLPIKQNFTNQKQTFRVWMYGREFQTIKNLTEAHCVPSFANLD